MKFIYICSRILVDTIHFIHAINIADMISLRVNSDYCEAVDKGRKRSQRPSLALLSDLQLQPHHSSTRSVEAILDHPLSFEKCEKVCLWVRSEIWRATIPCLHYQSQFCIPLWYHPPQALLSRVTCDAPWQADVWQLHPPDSVLTRDYHAN